MYWEGRINMVKKNSAGGLSGRTNWGKRRLESRKVEERHSLKAEAHHSETVVWG